MKLGFCGLPWSEDVNEIPVWKDKGSDVSAAYTTFDGFNNEAPANVNGGMTDAASRRDADP